ncbi:MAG: hypothetical protein AAF541_04740 [Pseudomonadota bacterium]
MQQNLLGLVTGTFRVMLLRGSPERVHYSRPRFLVGLALAILASALVEWLVYGDHIVFMILRLFAELTMFMLAVTLLTAKVARFRLAYAMLLLVWISVFTDGVLLLAAPLNLGDSVHTLGFVVGLIALYGAGNTVAWALRKPLAQGIMVMVVYAIAVICLDLAFQTLYDMVAFG